MIEPYDWQEPRVNRLSDILRSNPAALDASATGSGKTIVALAVSKALGKVPLVVAPKAVLTMWRDMAKAMGVPVLDVVNLEKLKTGKTPWVIKTGPKAFKWNLPPNSMINLDEVHKASGQDTLNGRMVAMAKLQNIPVLCMSATPFDSPLKMRTLGYLFGLHNYGTGDFWRFCRQYGCRPALFHRGLEFPKGPSGKKHLLKLFEKLSPIMVRQTVDDIPGFPENQIYCELVDLDAKYTNEINEIEAEFRAELKKGVSYSSALEKQLRARQRTELFKVPLLTDMAEGLIAEGNSVVIFAHFRETIESLHDALKGKYGASKIIGGQNQKVRDEEIRRFQADDSYACLATIQSGGQSVNLHHTGTSIRPRRSLVTPGFSAVEFVQCLGRIHRAGALSKAIQQIVLAAGTIEETNVYPAVQRKLGNITTLVDGDLSGV